MECCYIPILALGCCFESADGWTNAYIFPLLLMFGIVTYLIAPGREGHCRLNGVEGLLWMETLMRTGREKE